MAKPIDYGIIDPHKTYTFEGIERVLGITRAGIRALRKKGLAVKYLGKIGYVRGQDLIELVEAQGRATYQEFAP